MEARDQRGCAADAGASKRNGRRGRSAPLGWVRRDLKLVKVQQPS